LKISYKESVLNNSLHAGAPVEFDLKPDSTRLYLFFGGISNKIAMPPFEFYNAARILDENKIFIRDFSQSWYQVGLPGLSSDIETTARYLEEQIERLKPERVFWVGNSMGGYAALLFAGLLGRGQVIAFAPQTFITPGMRLKNRDFRWGKQILHTYLRSVLKRKAWNVKPLLLKNQTSLQISIYVSGQSRLDCLHADYLADLSNIKIHQIEDGGHGVVRVLRDQGKLPAILAG
jgi:hypothetical protein